MNASELLAELIKPRNTEAKTLNDVLTSVLEDSKKPNGIIGIAKMKTIKIKRSSGQDGVASFRGLDLLFNKDGIAEIPATLKSEVEIEMTYRPGVYSFVEEETVEEDITVLQMLEQAREDIKDILDDQDAPEVESNTELDEEDTKPTRKNRKDKKV